MLNVMTVDFPYISIFSTLQSEAGWQKTPTTLYWKDLPLANLSSSFSTSVPTFCPHLQEEFPPFLYAESHPLQRLAHRVLFLLL